jgi:PKD repeat protein
MTVIFTNLATFQTNSVWFFGNGVSNVLASASPSNSVPTGAGVTQIYTNAGSYAVTLVVMGTGGTNTLSKTAYIVVTNPVPTAAFAGGPTNGPAPLAVTFTNNSAYTYGTNAVWSFGDGTSLTNTTTTNLVHTYASAGTNTVILTVAGTGGTKSLTNTAYIVVTSGVVAPVAQFTNITPAAIFVTQGVTFTNTSSGGITNSLWNFGDTGTASLAFNSASNAVTHAWNTNGTYTVQLIVAGPGGLSTNSTTANYIVVKPKAAIGGVNVNGGGSLVFSGTNGPVGVQYRILTTTNVGLALTSWTPVYTNTFGAPNGNYGYTNTPGASASSFYLLVSP